MEDAELIKVGLRDARRRCHGNDDVAGKCRGRADIERDRRERRTQHEGARHRSCRCRIDRVRRHTSTGRQVVELEPVFDEAFTHASVKEPFRLKMPPPYPPPGFPLAAPPCAAFAVSVEEASASSKSLQAESQSMVCSFRTRRRKHTTRPVDLFRLGQSASIPLPPAQYGLRPLTAPKVLTAAISDRFRQPASSITCRPMWTAY